MERRIYTGLNQAGTFAFHLALLLTQPKMQITHMRDLGITCQQSK
jgi:lysine/ornithine N-monooxygenase